MGKANIRRTLKDQVYDAINEDINRGVLQPGDKLRVAHLAKRFGTSQAPVREALNRLTEDGLTTTEPYIGSVVREPSWAEIEEIYALRAELEAYAIRRALSQSPAVSIAPVRSAFKDLVQAVSSGDEVQVIDADLEFHRQVCSLSGSVLTVEVWEILMQRFRGARLSLLRKYPDDLSTVVYTHKRLIAGLEKGEASEAQEMFRNHLASAVVRFAEHTGNKLTAASGDLVDTDEASNTR